MYGLPQAGLIAQQQLKKQLNKHGYMQSKITPGLCTHKWHKITFSLVVDNVGVKYVRREHVNHFITVLEEHYEATKDWDGLKYRGISIV